MNLILKCILDKVSHYIATGFEEDCEINNNYVGILESDPFVVSTDSISFVLRWDSESIPKLVSKELEPT